MADAKVEKKLKQLVHGVMGIDDSECTPKASLVDDLLMDELDIVELCMAIEEEYGVEISDEDGDKLKTFEDVVNLTEKLIKK